MSWWYRVRRWLARKLTPKDLTVFMIDDAESVGVSNAYDPANHEGWFRVILQYHDEVIETLLDGSVLIHLYERPSKARAGSGQNCDIG